MRQAVAAAFASARAISGANALNSENMATSPFWIEATLPTRGQDGIASICRHWPALI